MVLRRVRLQHRLEVGARKIAWLALHCDGIEATDESVVVAVACRRPRKVKQHVRIRCDSSTCLGASRS